MTHDYLVNKTIGQVLESNAAQYPNEDALIYPNRDRRYTWGALNDEVDRLARGLLALGVKKNDRLAIWATNVPQWLTVLYASAKIGAILITVNTHYRKSEIEYLLKQSEANYLFMMDSFRGFSYVNAINEIAPELASLKPQQSRLNSKELPHLKTIVYLGDQTPPPGMLAYDAVLDLGAKVEQSELKKISQSLEVDDIINMQYTSGTTGFPKGVMLTHQNIVTNGYWIGFHQGLTQKDRICLPVPLFHCFGLVLGAMAALNHASAMIVLDIYSAMDILINVEKEKCTAIYGVPTMFISLLEQKSFNNFDLSTLRTGIMAGSPCPVKTMSETIERMNMRDITICYGMTETSPVVTQTKIGDSLDKRTQTVGRVMPGVELRICDPQSREDLRAGEIGEVAVRGYVNMKGYYNLPVATQEIVDEDGWIHTGDLGFFDSDGYLVITGRYKDMIIRAGENIYPTEVEEAIRHMPGVSDVAVVAVPSHLHGEELGAFIILDENTPQITVRDVKSYLRPLISGYKIPRFVKCLDKLPLTASGKIQKFKLREMASELWGTFKKGPKTSSYKEKRNAS
ncbi:MAG: AMP-binding protein [Deltaproteobacteria bacterium]|jgi:fatty-acyl-CoA synthase|nr:AMP-binding protein [Deltaproteobacteria bacterium]